MRICWCIALGWPFMGETMLCVCRRCNCATLVDSAATCCVSAAIDDSVASEGAGGVRATDPDALDEGMLDAPEPDAAVLPGPADSGDTALAALVEPRPSADEPEGDLPIALLLPVGVALVASDADKAVAPSTPASLLCKAAMVASAAANRDSSAVYSALDTTASEEATVLAPATPAGAAAAAALSRP